MVTSLGRENFDTCDDDSGSAGETTSGLNDFSFQLCSENATRSETVEDRRVEGRPSSVGCCVETSTRVMQFFSNSHVLAAVEQPQQK